MPRSWLICGIVLRLIALARAHLYFDEGNVLVLLREPWADQLDSLRRTVVYPPGWFALFRFTGGDELTVRLVCLALGIASLFLFDRLARETLEPDTARRASLLFLVSPMAIELSTEAKMYGAELFFLLLAFLAFERVLKGSQTAAAGLFLALAAAVSCQWLAAFAGPALALQACFRPGVAPRARALALGALALAAVVQLPWLATVAPAAQGAGAHVDVPRQLAGASLRPAQVATILVGLVGHNLPPVPGLGLRTVTALTLAIAAVALWRTRRGWLAAGVAIPVLLASAIAPTYPGYGNVAKYALAGFPALLLFLAGAGRLATSALVALGLLCLGHTFTEVSERELWHLAAAEVRSRPGDVVVWPPTAIMPLCAAEPGFAPDSPRLRLIPVLPYGRPVTRKAEHDLFQSLLWSLSVDAEKEVARLPLTKPFTVVLGRPLFASDTARAILDALARRHGPPRELLARPRIPVVYRFE